MDRLQQKLADNAMRRRRDEILSQFSGELQSLLANADCIMSDRIGPLVEGWYWAAPDIGRDDRRGKPAGWEHQECDNLSALGRMAGLVRMPAVGGYLWLGKEAPIMAVNCGVWNSYAWHLMNYVGQCADASLALVAEDRSAGLLISEYVGSLPKPMRTNNNEIVYELVTW
jgi:hypothetical protein